VFISQHTHTHTHTHTIRHIAVQLIENAQKKRNDAPIHPLLLLLLLLLRLLLLYARCGVAEVKYRAGASSL